MINPSKSLPTFSKQCTAVDERSLSFPQTSRATARAIRINQVPPPENGKLSQLPTQSPSPLFATPMEADASLGVDRGIEQGIFDLPK
jgi:hypothetical protein